jgi:hypothetical protein
MALPLISVEVNDPNAVMNLLSKEHQQLIKLEYDRQEKYAKAYHDKKCPHLVLHRKLMKFVNMKTTEDYLKLYVYSNH